MERLHRSTGGGEIEIVAERVYRRSGGGEKVYRKGGGGGEERGYTRVRVTVPAKKEEQTNKKKIHTVMLKTINFYVSHR